MVKNMVFGMVRNDQFSPEKYSPGVSGTVLF